MCAPACRVCHLAYHERVADPPSPFDYTGDVLYLGARAQSYAHVCMGSEQQQIESVRAILRVARRASARELRHQAGAGDRTTRVHNTANSNVHYVIIQNE